MHRYICIYFYAYMYISIYINTHRYYYVNTTTHYPAHCDISAYIIFRYTATIHATYICHLIMCEWLLHYQCPKSWQFHHKILIQSSCHLQTRLQNWHHHCDLIRVISNSTQYEEADMIFIKYTYLMSYYVCVIKLYYS